jgi:hypothetical protein
MVKDKNLKEFIQLIIKIIQCIGGETSGITIRYLPLGELQFRDLTSFDELLELKPLTEIIITFEDFKLPPYIERPIKLTGIGEVTGKAGTSSFIIIFNIDVRECKYEHGEIVEGKPMGTLKKVLEFIEKYGNIISTLISLATSISTAVKMTRDDNN